MKYFVSLLFALLILPLNASASYVSGINDPNTKGKLHVDEKVQKVLDFSISTYYQSPSVEKVNAVLDIMAETPLLERKTAWPALVGFLTIVFPANKDRVMSWMSRNDYNTYAQYVIVDALIHAEMRDSALLFAQAHQWSEEDQFRIRKMAKSADLKNLTITVPGHIDTLWGAFFASGDAVYVNEIIEHLLTGEVPTEAHEEFMIPDGSDPLAENKLLAANTLKDYAREHKPVRDALEKRYNAEPESSPKKQLFQKLLGK